MPTSSNALAVQGNLLTLDGQRYIAEGVNFYGIAFYLYNGAKDGALEFQANESHAKREEIAASMQQLGINMVRLPIGYGVYENESYQSKAETLQWIADYHATFKAHGIRLMLEDHSFTGQTAGLESNHSAAFPMFQDIANKIGANDPYLYWNPFNEPSGDENWASWLRANKSIVQWFRTSMGYQGPLFLDTVVWAWGFDPSAGV